MSATPGPFAFLCTVMSSPSCPCLEHVGLVNSILSSTKLWSRMGDNSDGLDPTEEGNEE